MKSKLDIKANLKVIYEKTIKTEATSNTPTNEASNESEQQDVASEEPGQTNNDQNAQEESENSGTSENTEAILRRNQLKKARNQPQNKLEVDADWQLEPGENGDLSSDKGKTNVFTAKKEGLK